MVNKNVFYSCGNFWKHRRMSRETYGGVQVMKKLQKQIHHAKISKPNINLRNTI